MQEGFFFSLHGKEVKILITQRIAYRLFSGKWANWLWVLRPHWIYLSITI